MRDNQRGSIGRTGPDRPVRIDDAWIGEFDQGLGWNDKPRRYRLLNAVLHAMRASLPADEMVGPGAHVSKCASGVCAHYSGQDFADAAIQQARLDQDQGALCACAPCILRHQCV